MKNKWANSSAACCVEALRCNLWQDANHMYERFHLKLLTVYSVSVGVLVPHSGDFCTDGFVQLRFCNNHIWQNFQWNQP
jgi:hypothetical protein